MNWFKKNVLDIYKLLDKLDTSKQYDVTIVEHNPKRKRTIEANNYYWHLVNLLGNKLRMSKEDIHFDMLKNYGQRALVTLRSDVAVNEWFKYHEVVAKKEKNGKTFISYMVYQGSSNNDSQQMNVLIKGVQQELEQQGVAYEESDIYCSNQ